MCLSVYLGSHERILDQSTRTGDLGISEAKWTPPALSKFPYRYYLGRKGDGDELECSCLLSQHIEWTVHGPTVRFDELYYPRENAFDDLRRYVGSAQRTGKPVMLVCDDLSGIPHDVSDKDYDQMVISRDMITAKTFLFVEPNACFPWRVFHLTAPEAN